MVREISRGGTGRVFLGERADGQFEQRVAIKLIQHADSLALLARRVAAIDSVALVRSALAGRAELLHARPLRGRVQMPDARAAAGRAVTALANGYGREHAWTRAAGLLVDSLAR